MQCTGHLMFRSSCVPDDVCVIECVTRIDKQNRRDAGRLAVYADRCWHSKLELKRIGENVISKLWVWSTDGNRVLCFAKISTDTKSVTPSAVKTLYAAGKWLLVSVLAPD